MNQAYKDQFAREIFKAYDIRGLLAQITPELARAVSYATVVKTGAKAVVLGRDMRETSPELLAAAIEGVNAAGAKAINIDLCTTSLFNYAVVSAEDAQAGIMITASHNPAQYNGIKMAYHNGLPISGTEIYESLVEVPAAAVGAAAVENERREVLESYVEHYLKLAGLKAGDCEGMKVAVDFGNGMGSLTIKKVLAILGVEAEYLYDIPDAHFPNHEANPAKHETLVDLQALVARTGAVLGVATDGDADRMGFVDGTGRILRGDQTLAFLTEQLASEGRAKKVVVAPNFGWDALRAIQATGAELLWCRIGRTFVIKMVSEEAADLGGEISSHFFFKDTQALEAVDYVLMLVLKGIVTAEKSFAELTDHLFNYVNSGEINLEVEDKMGAIERVRAELMAKATVVNELDGLRCEFGDDWWFIVRPSNTEPLLRLTVEAKNQATLEEKVAMMRALIDGKSH